MSTRLAMVLCVGLCACGGNAQAPPQNDAALPASDEGVNPSDAGEAIDAATCATQIFINPAQGVAPTKFIASAQVNVTSTPTWLVTAPDGSALVTSSVDPSGTTISVEAATPGSYDFQVLFKDGAACAGHATAIAYAPGAMTQSYRVRFTPPSASGLPQQDQFVTAIGATSVTQSFELNNGITLAGRLMGPSGAIAGQVSLAPQSGPPVLAVAGSAGTFTVPYSLDGTYTLLLVPADASLAPHLVGPIAGPSLAATTLQVGAGVVVSGLVRDASSQPLAGAMVALHAGALPSGLGTASSSGNYSLHVEPGTVSLSASASGWPDLTSTGIVVGASGGTFGIDEKATRLAVTLHALAVDGKTPLAGATLTLRSSQIANAGIVHAPDGDHAATGSVSLTLLTASDGTVSAQLPAADYDILVQPAASNPGSSTASVTGLHVTISAAGTVSLTVAAPVTLSGNVVDHVGKAIANARVRGVPYAGAAVVTTTDNSGNFTLTGIGAGLAVALDVSPPDGASFASAQNAIGDATHLGGVLPASTAVTLLAGVTVSGTVLDSSASSGLEGVALDVLCATCADQTPLYHTFTGTQGGYTLYLPDPGVANPPDGGVPGLD